MLGTLNFEHLNRTRHCLRNLLKCVELHHVANLPNLGEKLLIIFHSLFSPNFFYCVKSSSFKLFIPLVMESFQISSVIKYKIFKIPPFKEGCH